MLTLEPGADYSLEPISITPSDNASIDYNNGGAMLRQIAVVFPEGALVNPAVPVILSCDEARYSKGLLFEGSKGGSSVTYTAVVSPAPLVSGNYTLIIPGGAFGDASYIAGEGGKACPPMTLLYAVTGVQNEEGDDIDTVTYELMPAVTEIKKEGNLYSATMTWATAPMTDMKAVAACRLLDDMYFPVEVAGFSLTADESGKETVITFTADLDVNKEYRLVVAQGIFGNNTWINSGKKSGVANPQFAEKFLPSSLTVGVEGVAADRADMPRCIYTATGILLHRDATTDAIRNLPAGLYIIAGKKVMVK